MARFRKKPGQVSTSQESQPISRPSQKSTSLDSPLPSAHHHHRGLATLFAFRSNKPPPVLSDSTREDIPPGTQHRSLSKPCSTDLLPVDWPSGSSLTAVASHRCPRYVPIVIPDYARPPAARQPASLSLSLPLSLPPVRPAPVLTSGVSKPANPDAFLPADAKTGPSTASDNRAPEKFSAIEFQTTEAMNGSQVSLSASESGADQINEPPFQRTSAGSVGITSPINQTSAGGANLSGLVCNVHRTTGQEPHALVGATTTILGDKLYVFGGRVHSHSRSRAQLTSDLYELDLIERHWTKIEATGAIPPPRYFHSACALGDTKLVCYGGMSPAPHLRGQPNGQPQPSTTSQAADGQPEVVVMSDIHIFDVPTAKWFLVSASTAGSDGPQGRYAHCTAILPSSAVFASAAAPHSAIQHNRSSSDPHSGTLGMQLDGTGGAEMVVVGGQDSANNYIEQISVFNLRSLKWTNITEYDRKCGAYKSMVAPLVGLDGESVGRGLPLDNPAQPPSGTSMLIYSNYNFLDVKLELQVRLPDGTLVERQMAPGESPPGLRFPNGGVVNSHFVVSGTYLTSSKHEYALWALDLRTLSWHRIDTAGSVFSTGSWNRGILWNRRNQFVVLGHRKRNLVDDYNHRRINFSHICMVELEAFGLYDNPRKVAPSTSYVSRSSPLVPASLQSQLASNTAGGRQLSNIAEQLGTTAMTISEMSDMELVAISGERISCNSRILAKRWGPFFSHLMLEPSGTSDAQTISDATTLRANMRSQASRNSALTITPAATNGTSSSAQPGSPESKKSISQLTESTLVDTASNVTARAATRSRSLYLPHTSSTIRLLLYFLYNSSLPAVGSPLCSPHTLCSLLQMARPYQIDGLLEATVQRLHEVLDGRNAAAVFNAAAMAAGGGRATGLASLDALIEIARRESQSTAVGVEPPAANSPVEKKVSNLRVSGGRGHQKSNSVDSNSTATSASTSAGLSQADGEPNHPEATSTRRDRGSGGEGWTGEMSSVIGLQKRGLRGLMEGRRLREHTRPGATAEEGAPPAADH